MSVPLDNGDGHADFASELNQEISVIRAYFRAFRDAWRNDGAQQALRHWRNDPDLAGLRDATALTKLPAEERAACERLWADVDALLRKSGVRAY